MNRFIRFAAVAAPAAVPWPALAAAQSSAWGYGYGPHMMGAAGGWWHAIFGPLVMIVVVVALVAAILLTLKLLGGPWLGSGTQRSYRSDALDILKERYARGEIDKEEYEERRRILGE